VKINAQERQMNKATTQLRLYLHQLVEEYDLSISELMLILTDTTSKLFRRMVRDEHNLEE
jgi:hypothetical protein